jgi:hypothetical protein
MVLTVNTQLQHATSTRNFNTQLQHAATDMKDKDSTARKILLTHPRSEPSSNLASTALEPLLHQAFGARLARLGQLDIAIEKAHSLIAEIMDGAKTCVGVEWVPHKTRPGLHPVVHWRKHTLRSAVWGDGSHRRSWAKVLKHGYLQRYLDCMVGQEKRLIGPLAETFVCLQRLLDERERLLDTLAEIRRQLNSQQSALRSDNDPVVLLEGLEQQTAGVRAILFVLLGSK